jgi:hypothetical protein
VSIKFWKKINRTISGWTLLAIDNVIGTGIGRLAYEIYGRTGFRRDFPPSTTTRILAAGSFNIEDINR